MYTLPLEAEAIKVGTLLLFRDDLGAITGNDNIVLTSQELDLYIKSASNHGYSIKVYKDI